MILSFAGFGVQSAPPDRPADPPASPAQKSTLPPLPYESGTHLQFLWEHQGESYATTRIDIEIVRKEDTADLIRVRSQLDLDRGGRIVTGSSNLVCHGDVGHPVEYRHELTISAASLGGARSLMEVRFDGAVAELERQEGSHSSGKKELFVPVPTWLLDDQCFEHWVLLAPYLGTIPEDGHLTVFVPHGEGMQTYTVRLERTEGAGESRRLRWSIQHAALSAKIWTDPEGRLLEYLQGDVRIHRVVPPTPSRGEDREREKGSVGG